MDSVASLQRIVLGLNLSANGHTFAMILHLICRQLVLSIDCTPSEAFPLSLLLDRKFLCFADRFDLFANITRERLWRLELFHLVVVRDLTAKSSAFTMERGLHQRINRISRLYWLLPFLCSFLLDKPFCHLSEQVRLLRFDSSNGFHQVDMSLDFAVNTGKATSWISQIHTVWMTKQLMDARHQSLCLLVLSCPLQHDCRKGSRFSVEVFGLLLQERKQILGIVVQFVPIHYIYI